MLQQLKTTALTAWHERFGAKLVEFAGYQMPIKYNLDIIDEHLWVRNNCGLFDVSHMGQLVFTGKNLCKFFSTITPTNFTSCKDGECKYTVFLNENGGIIDDTIITKFSDCEYYVIVNASRQKEDVEHISKHLPRDISMRALSNNALIAIQGPKSEEVIAGVLPDFRVEDLKYMNSAKHKNKSFGDLIIGRTGYTGEAGFEISLPNSSAEEFWENLCKNKFVKPIGLGARDSLRLEMGYPLYGNDLNENTTPVEAKIGWVISSKESFVGKNKVEEQKQNPSLIKNKRTGVEIAGKQIMRHGYKIFNTQGSEIGEITSGGYSPTCQKSIAQGYILQKHDTNNDVLVQIRTAMVPGKLCSFSFVKAKTK